MKSFLARVIYLIARTQRMRVKQPEEWLCWYKHFLCHFSSSENKSFLFGTVHFHQLWWGGGGSLDSQPGKISEACRVRITVQFPANISLRFNPRKYFLLLLLLLATHFSIAFIPCEAIKKTCFYSLCWLPMESAFESPLFHVGLWGIWWGFLFLHVAYHWL